VLRGRGADTVVIVRNPSRRAVIEALGLTCVNVDSLPALARRFDLVVDATGAADGFATAAALLRPRGTLVVKSTIHGETPIALSPLVVDEITIVGSRCGPFGKAVAVLASREVQVAPLVEATYQLEQFRDAFERARTGNKVIFRFDHGS
jgi:alcohol dehydrogenase